jgi:hypothetical protein
MLAQLNTEDFRSMGEVRRSALGLATLVAMAVLAPGNAVGADRPEQATSQTHVLRQLYTSGVARMAKADPNGAIAVFRVATEVAPDLPQMHYSFGLAQVLADWTKRDRALPSLDHALAGDPGQPLFVVAKVLADPELSHLGTDGALYFSPNGAERLRTALANLEGTKSAVNGRYLRTVLSTLETTGDSRHPVRLTGFDRMLGQGGQVRLPAWNDSQAFARLFAVSIPDTQLQAFEPRMIARLQQGLDSLNMENLRRVQMKNRMSGKREQVSALRSHDPDPSPQG